MWHPKNSELGEQHWVLEREVGFQESPVPSHHVPSLPWLSVGLAELPESRDPLSALLPGRACRLCAHLTLQGEAPLLLDARRPLREWPEWPLWLHTERWWETGSVAQPGHPAGTLPASWGHRQSHTTHTLSYTSTVIWTYSHTLTVSHSHRDMQSD